jgi:hypothetical protein
MLSFNFWAVVHIDVVAMEAPADDLARFGFDTSAFAMGALPQPLGKRSVGFGRHRFCNAPLLLGCVLGARTKFDWAIAVVVSFHGQTTAAFAVPTALPVVPGIIAIMAVAHLSNSPAICSMVVHPRSTVSSKSEKMSSAEAMLDVPSRLQRLGCGLTPTEAEPSA